MTKTKGGDCAICKGEGWVCEAHERVKWSDGLDCCGAPGRPCECNTVKPPWDYVRTDIVEELNKEKI